MNQERVANKMGIDQSTISRIESGEVKVSADDVAKYLSALGGDETGAAYATHYASAWEFLKKPPFWHPNRAELVLAEETLGRLRDFMERSGIPSEVREQAKLYSEALLQAGNYILDQRHSVAFVGNIRVGKTAALCFLANLLVDGGGKEQRSLKQRAVLEVGAGWTTLCEVQVQEGGGRFGLVIQPHSDEEIFRLVSDMCVSFLAMRDGLEKENRVAEEVERALRSMAGLTRSSSKDANGCVQHHDPMLELSKTCDSAEALTAEVFARIKTHERTVCEIWQENPDKDAGLAWLQDAYRLVNNGRNTKVSLPKRIDVFVPFPLLGESPYGVTMIDTKGVDGTAIRPDLQAYLDDPRTVTVLCSLFAPDATMLGLLDHLVDTGKASSVAERLVLLVLPRPRDAEDLNNEDGTPAASAAEGYAMRAAQIRSKLSNFPGGRLLPIPFFDAMSDDPAKARECIEARIRAVRAAQAERVKELARVSEDLLANFQKAQVIAALEKVNRRLKGCLDAFRDLKPRTGAVHTRLLDAFKESHPRTVWASTRRSGSWTNLETYYWVGVGANVDARRRTDEALKAIEGAIEELRRDPDCKCVENHLGELLKRVAACRLKFLDEVTNRCKEIFRAVLFPDDGHWNTCKGYWADGKGFRAKVVERVLGWCEDDKHKWIHEAVEGITVKDWREFFVGPLMALCEGAPAVEAGPTANAAEAIVWAGVSAPKAGECE